MMEMNNKDIKSVKKEDKKEISNIIKNVENTKNYSVIPNKEREKKNEINQISNNNNQNLIDKSKINKKDGDNILNKLNNIQVNYGNKYNLNYDYNKLLTNDSENKEPLSQRNEKEKLLEMVNKEILKSGNHANHIIESLNKLKSNEYNFNERYNLGNGIKLNLENINKNIKDIQEIKIPNLNIQLEKALDKKNIQNNKNPMEPSSSIVNLNLNLNINNNIINNITTPNKANDENAILNEHLKNKINNAYNAKRAVSAKPDIRYEKKENSVDKINKNEDNIKNNQKDINAGVNAIKAFDKKYDKIVDHNKNSQEDSEKSKNSQNKKDINKINKDVKVDPFDFDFMIRKNPVLKEKSNPNSALIRKNDMSDLINYQDSDININNFDYLNIKNNNNINNNPRTSPNKIVHSDNSNIEKLDNIISTPNISKKPLNNQYLNLKNVNSYNKPSYVMNSNNNAKDVNKYKNNNINTNITKPYSRPESAKVPTSVKVSKKILDNNPSNKRVSPMKNLNLALDYNNPKNLNNNYNLNHDLNIRNKPRNLTPLKPIEGYKSPIINVNQNIHNENIYMRKNVIPSLNNINTNHTPVRVRPLSGVNPSIAKINNYNNKNNVKSSLINNKNDGINNYNKRNFTPTPSNIKSHRIELDANRRNYGINLSNNVLDNRNRVENNNINNNYNKIANVYSNRNNINEKYRLLDNNLDKINKIQLIDPLNKLINKRVEHDFNNYYNQGKNLENNYKMKIQNANLLKNNNNDYINNLYSNIYSVKDRNIPSLGGIVSGNRVLSGRK